MAKSVLFITYFFPPAGGPGVHRSNKFVKYLPQFGYQPIVLTVNAEAYRRDRLYKVPLDDSLSDDIPIHTPIYRIPPCHHPYRFLQLLRKCRLDDFVLVPDHFVIWLGAFIINGLKILRKYQIDLLYTTMGPNSMALVGLILKILTRKPWVADFRDPWTQKAIRKYRTYLHYKIQEMMERLVLRAADMVIANTPTSRTILLDKYRFLPNHKVSVIPNGFDAEDFHAAKLHLRSSQQNDKFTIAYTGVFKGSPADVPPITRFEKLRFFIKRLNQATYYSPYRADLSTHSIQYLMEAIRSLLDQHPDLRTKIRIQLIGSLHDNDRAFLNRGGLAANVEISGYISHRRAIEALCQADLLFLCLTSVRDRKLNEWVPQKTYEYLASGKPILAPLPEGDAKDLVTKAGTGIACSPNNTEEMRNTILRIYQAHADGEIPSSANEAFIAQFERKNLTARLASLFDQLIEG